MTREEAIERLREYAEYEDDESAHRGGDDVLCMLLNELGYQDVVTAWGTIRKWYS